VVTELVIVHRADGRTYTRRRPGNGRDREEHGSLGCFRAGCRCPSCRAARRDYDRLWYATRQALRSGIVNRRVSAHRTAQALEALRSAGWSWPKIAAESGFSIPALESIRRHPERRCWSSLEAAVLSIATYTIPT
jgi:hypothetical protein